MRPEILILANWQHPVKSLACTHRGVQHINLMHIHISSSLHVHIYVLSNLARFPFIAYWRTATLRPAFFLYVCVCARACLHIVLIYIRMYQCVPDERVCVCSLCICWIYVLTNSHFASRLISAFTQSIYEDIYIYIYIYMIYIYIYTYIWDVTCIYDTSHTYMRTYTHIWDFTYIYENSHTYLRTYTHIWELTYVHIHLFMCMERQTLATLFCVMYIYIYTYI